MKLTEREEDFLARIKDGSRLRIADREEDRVRQRMRKLGLAEVLRGPRRWILTPNGWAYFSRKSKET